MDIKSPEDRSRNMSAIKSRNTKPEIKLRKALFKEGLRFRINYKLLGKPDIVFVSKRVAIFVDGCFWHCCPICYCKPQNNREFWENKIQANKMRDKEVNRLLEDSGWRVLRIWEHDVKKNLPSVVERIRSELSNVRVP